MKSIIEEIQFKKGTLSSMIQKFNKLLEEQIERRKTQDMDVEMLNGQSLRYIIFYHQSFYYDDLLPQIAVNRFRYLICQSVKQKYQILKNVSHIKFQNLTRLFFISCEISNIEPLAFMQIKNIQSLIVRQNFITNLKPLAKTNWPYFESISITFKPFTGHTLTHLCKVRYTKKTNKTYGTTYFQIYNQNRRLSTFRRFKPPFLTISDQLFKLDVLHVGNLQVLCAYVQNPKRIACMERKIISANIF